MKEERESLTESEIDAISIKLLDYYADGEYGYEEGVNKTIKQRNLKRTLKDEITAINKNPSGKVYISAMYGAILSLIEPCKLRNENKLLRQKLKLFDNKDAKSEALAMTLYKDEIYKRIKEEKDQELVDNLESSRIVNRKLMDIVSGLEGRLSAKKNYVPREKLKALEAENLKLTMDIAKNKKTSKLSKKEKKMKELKRQMELLESSDEEDIEVITEQL